MRSGAWLLLVAAGCRFGFDPIAGATDGDARMDTLGDGQPPPAFEPYWQSGTRVRARVLVPVDGGDPYWIGWHDTMLNMDCRNGNAADGVERCVPQGIRADRFFADASCTVRLAHVRVATCGTPTYATWVDPMGRFRGHPVGAVHAGAVFENTGSCVSSAAPSDGALHVVGTEIDPALLVTAAYKNQPVGDFVRPMQGFVDDAFLEIGSLVTPLGPCYPHASELGPSRCQLSAPPTEPVYTDPGCTQRAYYWDRSAFENTSTPYVRVLEPTACANAYKLYATTADVTAATHYRQTPTGCQPAASSTLARMYRATEVTDPSPDGTIVVGPRRGRLGWLYWVGSDNLPFAVRYWDHDLQIPCLPINGSDGKLRCLPAKLDTLAGAHPNGTCAGATQTVTPACFPGTPVDGPDYTSCMDEWTVSSLPSIGTTVSTFNDTCTSRQITTGFYDPLGTGNPLPPSMFAEMIEMLD